MTSSVGGGDWSQSTPGTEREREREYNFHKVVVVGYINQGLMYNVTVELQARENTEEAMLTSCRTSTVAGSHLIIVTPTHGGRRHLREQVPGATH